MNSILRDDLLAGRAVTVAAPGTSPLATALRELGAEVDEVTVDDTSLDEHPVAAYALVVDLRESPTARAALDAAWTVVRPAGAADIPKIILVAPPTDDASRSGIENLARTTSIEWARNQTRTAAILPAASSPDAVIADLVAYLVSDAGDYFSGAALTLTA
jgi:hypothetical protein